MAEAISYEIQGCATLRNEARVRNEIYAGEAFNSNSPLPLHSILIDTGQ